MAKYSEAMKAYMDANNINPKNVLYLPIAQVHLRRIASGEKIVEFREDSDFYLKKFYNVANNEITTLKPITHMLFQGGYSPTSPRVLVQFVDCKVKEPNAGDPITEIGWVMDREALREGFEPEDGWLGIALGKVEFVENL